MANPYKTHWYNRQASHWFRKAPERQAGTAEHMECLRLDPVQDAADAAPVRIYLGTEPEQYRATRVFVWSVMKHRDPARAYEIYLMSDIAGIDRTGWKTGFTNYRYAIPHLAGNTGRAIYNDVDQIYLSDPALLFDSEMAGKGVLAISEKENSVMLIDCDVMGPLWTVADVEAGHKHAHFKGVMTAGDLLGVMPGTWNSRDGEYPIEQTDCLHYTTLHLQPWRPFPELLKYAANPLGQVWHDLERAADEAGFLLFTAAQPTMAFAHVAMRNAVPVKPASKRRAVTLRGLLDRFSARSLLVCGAQLDLPQSDVEVLAPHAPANPFVSLPDGQADGVVAFDMVEQVPPLDVPWVLDALFARAGRFVFVTVGDTPESASTQAPANWWHSQMALAGRRYRDVHWVLGLPSTGLLGGAESVLDRSVPSPLD